MTRHVQRAKGPLKGTVRVPGDKSISHRAVMLGALAHGTTEIAGFLPGADCLSTVACVRALGVDVEQTAPDRVIVRGGGAAALREAGEVLDVGNSGTTLRLLSGILAGLPVHTVLTGDASIRRRPMDRVAIPLRQMGAHIDGRDGGRLAPISIRGGALKGIAYESPVASAQVKSAVLLAGLLAEGQTAVTEPSRSRDHTERLLAGFGAQVEVSGVTARVTGGGRLEGQRVVVPGDISSAAFILVAASLVPGSEVLVQGVGLNPTRTGIVDILQAMGADISVSAAREEAGEPVGDLLVRSAVLQGVTVAGELVPRAIDELPLVATAACFAQGETVIRDAAELRVKESDRIARVAGELRRLGAEVEELPDGMVIRGPQPLRGAAVESHHDHRLAMSLAVAALNLPGETAIAHSGAVDVSFPGFFALLDRLQQG